MFFNISFIFISYTLQTLGAILIGFMALMVHHRFLYEHKIDSRVFAEMKREQFLGGLGVFFLVAGYVFWLFA
ncbi:MAG: hypothetical protein HYT28_01455 [Parcubacteria group bacterium]|nr:hypothetical protein [Parcubacteria group bacterium]